MTDRGADNGAPILSICIHCRPAGRDPALPRPGADLARRIGSQLAAGHMFTGRLRHVQCMSQCRRPCVVAFSGPQRFTYLFGDLDPALHATEVLATFAVYQQKDEGFLERADRAPPLRAGILARVPPLITASPLVEDVALSCSDVVR